MLIIYKTLSHIILDYRQKVPSYAKILFAYDFLICMYPICLLLSLMSSLLDVNILKQYHFIDESILPSLNISSSIILIMSLYICAKGFYKIYKISLNMFHVQKSKGLIIDYITIIVKVLILFFLLVVIMTMITVIPIINTLFLYNLKNLEILFLFFIIMFLLYKIIPDIHIHYIDIMIGALCSSILFVLLINIIQLYLYISDYTYLYGPLSSIVIVLLTLSFVGEIIYIGMYIVYRMDKLRNEKKLEMGC